MWIALVITYDKGQANSLLLDVCQNQYRNIYMAAEVI